MQKFTLDQFRTAIEAGGILSVALVGQGGAFHIEAETRRGQAVLTKARSAALREFRDATKALGLLRELGIREARIDTRAWRPEEAELGRPARPDRAKAMKDAHAALKSSQGG